jgi:protein subunit release factor B
VEKKRGEMELPTQIQDKLDALGVLRGDVTERFVRGSGPGGQKINKTSSTVHLRHEPTGVEVRVQRERSQAANRELAWAELCEKLLERFRAAERERQQAVAKAKRRARPKSRRQKAIQVAGKRQRASVKAQRGKVNDE